MPKELPLKVTVDLEALKKTRDEVKKLEEELQLRKAPGRLKAVQDEIANLEKGAEKAGMTIGKAFGAGLASVAASFTALRLKAFFSEASESASRLEQAMAGVSSVANAFKQDAGSAQAAARALAKDGFLTLEQAATSVKNLMSSGMTVNQAREFIEAEKNIGAFGNTISNAGAAVQDLTKGILTNSAEVIENLSAEMKGVNSKYQEMVTKVGKATAVQYLFNETMKLGNKYSGDASRFMETYQGRVQQMTAVQERLNQQIGKQVQELMTPLIGFWVNGLKVASDFFGGLSGGGQKFILIMVSLGAVLLSTIPIFKLFWASALGPIGLLLAAIPIIAAFGLALTEAFNDKTRGQALLEEQKKLSDLVEQLKKTTGSAKELAEAQAKLVDVTKKLNDEYGPYLKNLGAENQAYLLKLNTLKAIDEAIKAQGGIDEIKGMSDAQIKGEIGRLRTEISKAESGGKKGSLFGSTLTVPTAENVQRVSEMRNQLNILETEFKKRKPSGITAGGGTGPAPIDFRFIEARDALVKLNKEFDAYIKREKDAGKIAEANLKLTTLRRQMISDLTAEVAGYNEEVTMQETAAEDSKFMKQIAAIERRRELELEAINRTAKTQDEKTRETERVKTQHRQARETAEKQHQMNMARIQAQAISVPIAAMGNFVSGLNQIRSAKDFGGSVGGFGSTLSGFGGMESAFKKGGIFGENKNVAMLAGSAAMAGPIMGLAGGLISGMTSLFSKSDEERAKEAEAAERQREEQLHQLELASMYQKAQLALAEASAKLPFENLQRNLRLIDIETQRAQLTGMSQADAEAMRLTQRQTALSSTLTEQAGEISKGKLFAGTGSSAGELIGFLNKRASESVAVSQFSQYADALQNGQNLNSYESILGAMRGLQGRVPNDIYGPVMSQAEAGLNQMFALAESVRAANMSNVTFLGLRDLDTRSLTAALGIKSTPGGAATAAATTAAGFESEFRMDVGTAENLLSVLEQSQATQLEIEAASKKTADNTGKLLQMPKAEQATFVDIGRGFTQSLGMLNAPVNAQNVTLPSALSSVMLATQTGAGNADPVLSRLDAQLGVQRAMLGTLATIAAILDGDSSTDANATRDTIKAILADVKYRTLAA